MSLLDRIDVTRPIFQAPMAGVSTPQMAAAVSNAGGLGAIAVGGTDAAGARAMIDELRRLTDRPFNVNVFVHPDPQPNAAREAAWLDALRPLFAQFNAEPPAALHSPYRSFANDGAMLATLVDCAPAVVSFHFGLPGEDRIVALKHAGCVLLATVTNLDEARAAQDAGIDALVAQGHEAGGHRGTFDPHAPDPQLGVLALTRLLVAGTPLPVIAAGGIMDGQGVRAALDLGSVAAQLGTAFIACPESSADTAYRAALAGPTAERTVMTRAISGRLARCLANGFTQWEAHGAQTPPSYPIAYHAGKALNAAAKAAGDHRFGAQWAGQGAPLSRPTPAAALVALLCREAGLDD